MATFRLRTTSPRTTQASRRLLVRTRHLSLCRPSPPSKPLLTRPPSARARGLVSRSSLRRSVTRSNPACDAGAGCRFSFSQVQARLRAHTTSTAVAVMDLAPVDVPATYDDADVRGSRCESCGGVADDGDLCAACKNAFHSLFDNSARPVVAEPSGASPDVEATVILPTSVALSAQPSPVADTSVISVPAAVAPVVVAAPVADAAPAAAAPSTSAPVVAETSGAAEDSHQG